MDADSGVKSRFNKKLLAIAVIVIVVAAVVVSWQIIGHSSNSESEVTLPALSLTLVGANGQQKILNANELGALTSITASGGYNDTDTGTIYSGNFTGVPISTLLNQVGGITSSDNITFIGSDGYQITCTYQQVEGQGINTFNPTTGAPIQSSQALTVIAAYFCNGTTIASGKGPLTVAIVGPQGLYTDGYWWAYLLVKIEVIPA